MPSHSTVPIPSQLHINMLTGTSVEQSSMLIILQYNAVGCVKKTKTTSLREVGRQGLKGQLHACHMWNNLIWNVRKRGTVKSPLSVITVSQTLIKTKQQIKSNAGQKQSGPVQFIALSMYGQGSTTVHSFTHSERLKVTVPYCQWLVRVVLQSSGKKKRLYKTVPLSFTSMHLQWFQKMSPL